MQKRPKIGGSARVDLRGVPPRSVGPAARAGAETPSGYGTESTEIDTGWRTAKS
jgi:hypothetical protein